MALFASKKNKTTEKKSPKTKAVVEKKESPVVSSGVDFGGKRVLLGPRVTEKVTMLSEVRNVITFHIADGATKKDVEKAIGVFYKVKPVKVRIARIPRKRTFIRGRRGVKSGGRKAYVYLKAGDKIEMA